MANLPSRLTHAAVRGRALDLAGGRGGAPFEDDASDMCYVKDCAKGIQLVHNATNLTQKIYNIGAGKAQSNKELADGVAAVSPGFAAGLQTGKGPRARNDAYMDISAATRDAGYQPDFDIRSGVADYAGWLKDHEE